jgi:hypothetical protein
MSPSGMLTSFHGNQGASLSTELYQSVVYGALYPGIDLRYQSVSGHLKSEFIVHPGADSDAIRMVFRPGGVISMTPNTLQVEDGQVRFIENNLAVYQDVRGSRTRVTASYRLFPDNSVGFELGEYDRSTDLVIDPVILFSTYWGGNLENAVTGVATGSDGSVYATGWTESNNVPVLSPFQMFRGSIDAFVVKLNPAGTSIVYATYIGGTGNNKASAIAVDSLGGAAVVGYTDARDFPVLAASQPSLGGYQNAFIVKLAPAGSTLTFSTYLGGSGADQATAVQTDSSESTYVAGFTTSANFPVKNALQATKGGLQNAFFAKYSAAGAVAFSSYLGGSGTDAANGLGLASGDLIVAGATSSPNFPLKNAFQTALNGGQDAFVTRILSTGLTVVYSSYLGGSGGSPGAPEFAAGVAVDSAGEAIVVGMTPSSNFPLLNPAQGALAGGTHDGFVTKISAAGTLEFSTYLGGSSEDYATSAAVDPTGNIYVAGYTASPDFPVVTPLQSANAGTYDAFVTSYTAAGVIQFSTYFGGGASDSAASIAVYGTQSVVFGGTTMSGNFPTSSAVVASAPSGYSGFLTAISGSNPTSPGTGAGIAASVATFLNGAWYLPAATYSFGIAGDIPVVGDWTGTGYTKIGVYRPSTQTWYLDANGDGFYEPGVDFTGQFGLPGDVPIVGDWSGSGTTKIGIYRPSSSLWALDKNGNMAWDSADIAGSFGLPGDKPVLGDWTGSGTTKVGIFRPSNAIWALDMNGNLAWDASDTWGSFGFANDIPVVGDWNGSHKTKVGIFRPSNGLWALDVGGTLSWTAADTDGSFGFASDTPVVGDWTNTGVSRAGIYRPTAAVWALNIAGNLIWTPSLDTAGVLGPANATPIVGRWR